MSGGTFLGSITTGDVYMSDKSIFGPLGLLVKSIEDGVYLFQRINEKGEATGEEVVGLLLLEAPLSFETTQVKLFTQLVVADVSAARIIRHWQTLDARRLEESGLEALLLDISADLIPDAAVEQAYTRPDGVRLRHTVRLCSGEVVCYN